MLITVASLAAAGLVTRLHLEAWLPSDVPAAIILVSTLAVTHLGLIPPWLPIHLYLSDLSVILQPLLFKLV